MSATPFCLFFFFFFWTTELNPSSSRHRPRDANAVPSSLPNSSTLGFIAFLIIYSSPICHCRYKPPFISARQSSVATFSSACAIVIVMAGTTNHRARGSEDYNVFDDAKTYYASEERHQNRFGSRTRTYSQVLLDLSATPWIQI